MDVGDMDMVDMDMVDMDMMDMDMVDMDNGHGHSGPRKRSIAMVHYWVRHAKCTWSSFYSS